VVGVSMLTAPPNYEKIAELTYSTVSAGQREENRNSWGVTEVIMTIVVLGLVLGIYLYFSHFNFWLK
jgi:SSS family solute:Na+ symporter